MLQNFKQHQLASEEAQSIKGGKIITPPPPDDSTESDTTSIGESITAFGFYWND